MLSDVNARLRHDDPRLPERLAEIRRRRAFTLASTRDPQRFADLRDVCGGEPLVAVGLGIRAGAASGEDAQRERFDAALNDAALVSELTLEDPGPGRSPGARWTTVVEHVLVAAAGRGLTVVATAAGAEDDLVRALRRQPVPRLIVHAYRGPVRAFSRLVDLGAWFAVGPLPDGDDVAREIAATVPEERVLLCTSGAGPRSDAALLDVRRSVAAARRMRVAELQEVVRANLARLVAAEDRLRAAWERAAASLPD